MCFGVLVSKREWVSGELRRGSQKRTGISSPEVVRLHFPSLTRGVDSD